MDIGPGELIVIAVVIIVLFGAKRLPELARNLGRAKLEFDRAINGHDDSPDTSDTARQETTAPPSQAQPRKDRRYAGNDNDQ